MQLCSYPLFFAGCAFVLLAAHHELDRRSQATSAPQPDALFASARPVVPIDPPGPRIEGSGWQTLVLGQLEQEEHRPSRVPGDLQAPNRAHNLRTYFRENGIEVMSRENQDRDSWHLRWRTTRWGPEPRDDGSILVRRRDPRSDWKPS